MLVPGEITRSISSSFQTARPNCQSMRPKFSLFCLSVLVATMAFAATSWAFVAPLQTDGQHFYLHTSDRWQIAVANIDLKPRFEPTNPDKVLHSWTVDAEFWLRNVSKIPRRRSKNGGPCLGWLVQSVALNRCSPLRSATDRSCADKSAVHPSATAQQRPSLWRRRPWSQPKR